MNNKITNDIKDEQTSLIEALNNFGNDLQSKKSIDNSYKNKVIIIFVVFLFLIAIGTIITLCSIGTNENATSASNIYSSKAKSKTESSDFVYIK